VASVGCVGGPSPAGETCPVFNAQCNAGACDGAGTCDVTAINEGAACDDYDLCTTGETCQSGSCTGGQTAPGTTIYLEQDFNAPLPNTWTVDPCGWEVTHGEQAFPIAGTGNDLVVGGGFLSGIPAAMGKACPTDPNAWHYAVTPGTDLSKENGRVYLTFFHFWSPGSSIYGGSHGEVAVDVYDGSVWQRVLYEQQLAELSWHTEVLDVTSFKSASFMVRFGYVAPGGGGTFADGIDDVTLATAPCAAGNITLGN
jgi:hypothetical protein